MSDFETSSLSRAAITRRRSRIAFVGGIPIGGGSPIVVQSMTNTDTSDVAATVAQVKALADAGSELVRMRGRHGGRGGSGAAIRRQLDALGCHAPLIGDLPFQRPQCSAIFRTAPWRSRSTASIGQSRQGQQARSEFAIMTNGRSTTATRCASAVNWGSLDPDCSEA